MIAIGIKTITGISTITIPPQSFSPMDISGIVTWLDANQIIGLTDGDSVNTWNDASGNNINAVKGAFNAPTYQSNQLNGKPVVKFLASSSQALRAYYSTAGKYTPYTLFIVGRLTGGANGRILGSVYSAYANYLLGWWNGFESTMYAEGFVKSGTVEATTNWRQYTGNADGAQSWFYEKGILLANNSSGYSSPNGGLALSGYDPSSTLECSNCEIAEIILYDTKLSDIDRNNVETYLISKYNL